MELINREEIKATIRNMREIPDIMRVRVLAVIGLADAVDAVEVVRCKDCKLCFPGSDFVSKHCSLTGIPTDDDDFCSYGERGTDNG